MGKFVDLTGQTFGRLTVIKKDGHIGKDIAWDCICVCGNHKRAIGANLRNKLTQSCGCLQKERCSISNSKSNDYIINNNIVQMKTAKGQTFIIDIDDLEQVKEYCWRISKGYIVTGLKQIQLHRLLTNCPDDMIADHINGNKLDNRKSNLRICTKQQNAMNCKVSKNNTSGVTGVTWNKQNNNWIAQISINRKNIHIGSFDKFEDAKKARREAEDKYFGEYAYSNSR